MEGQSNNYFSYNFNVKSLITLDSDNKCCSNKFNYEPSILVRNLYLGLLQSNAGHRPLSLYATLIDFGLLASSFWQQSCVSLYSTWLLGILRYVCRDAVRNDG